MRFEICFQCLNHFHPMNYATILMKVGKTYGFKCHLPFELFTLADRYPA